MSEEDAKQHIKIRKAENFRLATLLEDIRAGALKNSKDAVNYCADDFVRGEAIDDFGRLQIGRFMPRWASRILLECEEDARVERLRSISEEDAVLEGCIGDSDFTAVMRFAILWKSLHTKPGERWEDNPRVIRVGRFRRIQ